jgi:hypothetical protein
MMGSNHSYKSLLTSEDEKYFLEFIEQGYIEPFINH